MGICSYIMDGVGSYVCPWIYGAHHYGSLSGHQVKKLSVQEIYWMDSEQFGAISPTLLSDAQLTSLSPYHLKVLSHSAQLSHVAGRLSLKQLGVILANPAAFDNLAHSLHPVDLNRVIAKLNLDTIASDRTAQKVRELVRARFGPADYSSMSRDEVQRLPIAHLILLSQASFQQIRAGFFSAEQLAKLPRQQLQYLSGSAFVEEVVPRLQWPQLMQTLPALPLSLLTDEQFLQFNAATLFLLLPRLDRKGIGECARRLDADQVMDLLHYSHKHAPERLPKETTLLLKLLSTGLELRLMLHISSRPLAAYMVDSFPFDEHLPSMIRGICIAYIEKLPRTDLSEWVRQRYHLLESTPTGGLAIVTETWLRMGLDGRPLLTWLEVLLERCPADDFEGILANNLVPLTACCTRLPTSERNKFLQPYLVQLNEDRRSIEEYGANTKKRLEEADNVEKLKPEEVRKLHATMEALDTAMQRTHKVELLLQLFKQVLEEDRHKKNWMHPRRYLDQMRGRHITLKQVQQVQRDIEEAREIGLEASKPKVLSALSIKIEEEEEEEDIFAFLQSIGVDVRMRGNWRAKLGINDLGKLIEKEIEELGDLKAKGIYQKGMANEEVIRRLREYLTQ